MAPFAITDTIHEELYSEISMKSILQQITVKYDMLGQILIEHALQICSLPRFSSRYFSNMTWSFALSRFDELMQDRALDSLDVIATTNTKYADLYPWRNWEGFRGNTAGSQRPDALFVVYLKNKDGSSKKYYINTETDGPGSEKTNAKQELYQVARKIHQGVEVARYEEGTEHNLSAHVRLNYSNANIVKFDVNLSKDEVIWTRTDEDVSSKYDICTKLKPENEQILSRLFDNAYKENNDKMIVVSLDDMEWPDVETWQDFYYVWKDPDGNEHTYTATFSGQYKDQNTAHRDKAHTVNKTRKFIAFLTGLMQATMHVIIDILLTFNKDANAPANSDKEDLIYFVNDFGFTQSSNLTLGVEIHGKILRDPPNIIYRQQRGPRLNRNMRDDTISWDLHNLQTETVNQQSKQKHSTETIPAVALLKYKNSNKYDWKKSESDASIDLLRWMRFKMYRYFQCFSEREIFALLSNKTTDEEENCAIFYCNRNLESFDQEQFENWHAGIQTEFVTVNNIRIRKSRLQRVNISKLIEASKSGKPQPEMYHGMWYVKDFILAKLNNVSLWQNPYGSVVESEEKSFKYNFNKLKPKATDKIVKTLPEKYINVMDSKDLAQKLPVRFTCVQVEKTSKSGSTVSWWYVDYRTSQHNTYRDFYSLVPPTEPQKENRNKTLINYFESHKTKLSALSNANLPTAEQLNFLKMMTDASTKSDLIRYSVLQDISVKCASYLSYFDEAAFVWDTKKYMTHKSEGDVQHDWFYHLNAQSEMVGALFRNLLQVQFSSATIEPFEADWQKDDIDVDKLYDFVGEMAHDENVVWDFYEEANVTSTKMMTIQPLFHESNLPQYFFNNLIPVSSNKEFKKSVETLLEICNSMFVRILCKNQLACHDMIKNPDFLGYFDMAKTLELNEDDYAINDLQWDASGSVDWHDKWLVPVNLSQSQFWINSEVLQWSGKRSNNLKSYIQAFLKSKYVYPETLVTHNDLKESFTAQGSSLRKELCLSLNDTLPPLNVLVQRELMEVNNPEVELFMRMIRVPNVATLYALAQQSAPESMQKMHDTLAGSLPLAAQYDLQYFYKQLKHKQEMNLFPTVSKMPDVGAKTI